MDRILSKEPETINWIKNFPKDSVFFDVGANIGIYTLYSAVMQQNKVFAFEPHAASYKNLLDSINLNNFTFPFLRYDIGDFSSKKKFLIDKPIVKKIYGRDYGTFKTPSGKTMNGIVFPHKFGQFKGISDFHIKLKNDKINIFIVPNHEYDEITDRNIKNLILNKTDPAFKLKIIKVNYIKEYLQSGKKKIISFE